ncbi:hypothetical protein M0811_01985 [Anaeramoeba ignava]|uniref:Uncharacterized protein n=1 Tax=Anaeramoeba ignava TaxID=1746090 RepID=A0A9Q0LGD9_ANAIG|nr:hypothetical protein M0811_01985 [Anaeramoeba ignava]
MELKNDLEQIILESKELKNQLPNKINLQKSIEYQEKLLKFLEDKNNNKKELNFEKVLKVYFNLVEYISECKIYISENWRLIKVMNNETMKANKIAQLFPKKIKLL